MERYSSLEGRPLRWQQLRRFTILQPRRPSTALYNPSSISPTPILLTHLRKLETGAFQFEFRNTPGLIFSVLSAADLAIPLSDWPTLGSAAENTPGHYHFTDPQAAQDLQRFYRVRSPN